MLPFGHIHGCKYRQKYEPGSWAPSGHRAAAGQPNFFIVNHKLNDSNLVTFQHDLVMSSVSSVIVLKYSIQVRCNLLPNNEVITSYQIMKD